jgi:hypothetical protein
VPMRPEDTDPVPSRSGDLRPSGRLAVRGMLGIGR